MCFRKFSDVQDYRKMKRKHESNNGSICTTTSNTSNNNNNSRNNNNNNSHNSSIHPHKATSASLNTQQQQQATTIDMVAYHPTTTTTTTTTSGSNNNNNSDRCTRSLQCDMGASSAGQTDAGVMTDMDLLGPCEPGTAVVLEGIVWTESNNGILVVNVTWRGKTYVGTLMDATKHHWAPPRYREDSPVMDLDWKTPKYRNGRNTNNSNNANNSNNSANGNNNNNNNSNNSGNNGNSNNNNNDSPMIEGRRLRKCRRNNNSSNNGNSANSNNNNSTVNSLRSQSSRQSPIFSGVAETNSNSRRRSRNVQDQQQQQQQQQSDDAPVPAKKPRESKPEADSPQVLWECEEESCGKKFKHATGLKYHRSHAHRKLPAHAAAIVVGGAQTTTTGAPEEEPRDQAQLPSRDKKSRKSARNPGTPDTVKSESPVAEIVEAFGAGGRKADPPKTPSEADKLTPEPDRRVSPVVSETRAAAVAEQPETTRPGKRVKTEPQQMTADEKCSDVVKATINSNYNNNSSETRSVHSSSTESRVDPSNAGSPLAGQEAVEDCKPVDFAGYAAHSLAQAPKTPSPPARANFKATDQSSDSVPENLIKVEPNSAATVKHHPHQQPSHAQLHQHHQQQQQHQQHHHQQQQQQQRDIKQEPTTLGRSQSEAEKAWRERLHPPPPLVSQNPPMAYPSPSVYGFGIDPLYHMQLLTSPEYKSQIDRWMTEQHLRHMFAATGRYDQERHVVASASSAAAAAGGVGAFSSSLAAAEAKPVDMTLKSANDASRSSKKSDQHQQQQQLQQQHHSAKKTNNGSASMSNNSSYNNNNNSSSSSSDKKQQHSSKKQQQQHQSPYSSSSTAQQQQQQQQHNNNNNLATEDKKRLSSSAFKLERPDSRHQDSSPGQTHRPGQQPSQPPRPLPSREAAEMALFQQVHQQYPYVHPHQHPLSKIPFDVAPGSPFLDPSVVPLSRQGHHHPHPHFLDRGLLEKESIANRGEGQAKTPSGKRSVEAFDDLHKEGNNNNSSNSISGSSTPSSASSSSLSSSSATHASSFKDKLAGAASSASPLGHNSPLTLRHLHTHHHTHVLGPAYSLYGSYNGLVPPVPPGLVPPVVPVIPPSFIPK